MKDLGKVALALLVVGGLNWGLVGLLKLNLVTILLQEGLLANVVYILIGVAAVYVAATSFSKK